MRAYEFEKPLTIQQAQDKALKQQAARIEIQRKQRRLQKQRERAAATAAQLTKLQNKSP
jgi:hypothetical protein